MGRRLSESLSSGYFAAANRLNSRTARRRIVAYVESYDDVFFWRTVLTHFETPQYFFQVMLPSRGHLLKRGKKAVLMNLLRDRVGTDMIACVDADYDYLVQGATPTSHEVVANPYVFHTYAYAIENLQCYAPSLHDVCVAITLNDHDIFDIEGFMSSYSEIIYPLFVWSIWYYRTPRYTEFTLTDFLAAIEMGRFDLAHAADLLQRLQGRVARRVAALRRRNPSARDGLAAVEADLHRLGVTPATTYLYIQGHHLFDRVVVPMLTMVCTRLIREREQEITRESMHATQRRNELSCYANSVADVAVMLKKNLGYVLSEPFRRIQADVEHFMAARNANPEP